MTFRQFFRIVEMRTKAVSVSTFSMAVLYSAWRTGAIRLWETFVCFVAVFLVDMGTTAFNSYFDFRRGVDAAATNKEEDKILLHEEVSPCSALLIAMGCFDLAGVLGIILAFMVGFWIIALGAICLAAGFLYSGGPKPVSRTPFGELFAGGFLGTVLFVIVARVASGAGGWEAAAASAPGAFIVASILAANNRCDMEGDAAAGRRTLPIVFGARWGEASLYVGGLVAFGLPAIFAVLGIYPAWSALGTGVAAAIAFPEYRKMAGRGYSHETKGPTMGSVIKIFALWSLGMAVGFAAGIILG